MKLKNKIAILVVLIAMSLGPLAIHIFGQNDPVGLENEIQSVFDKRKMSGLAIAVVSGDSIIYQKAMGHRVLPEDGKPGDALREDDLFALASVSKTFIATVIMRLVDDNKLKLDDDAQKYLGFRLRNPYSPSKKITVKHLLTHTSGISDSHGWWNIEYIKPEQDKEYYKSYTKNEPGKHYEYCNLNYTLLGGVIEGVTGKRFDDVVDEIIMQPLGLGGSFNTNKLDPGKFVDYYYYDKSKKKREVNDYFYRTYKQLEPASYELGKNLSLEYPAAGMKITSGDLAKYMMMHMNDGKLGDTRVISAKSERLMQKNYVGSSNYGLSYRQYTGLIPGSVLHGQTGGGGGVKTCMIFDRDRKIGFVILSAGADSDYIDGYEDIHKPLIKILYKYLFADGE